MFVVCCENLWKQLSITWVQFIWYSSLFRRQNISPLQLFLEYSAGIQLKQRAHNSFVFESRSLPMPSIYFQSGEKNFLQYVVKGALISFQSRKMFSLQLHVKGTQPILDCRSNCPGKESFLCGLNWHFYH